MGLDVYLARSVSQEDFTGVSWREVLEWGDFPFQPTTEPRPVYSKEGEYIGDGESNPFIGEIDGPMWVYPGARLSFRGRRYSDLLEAIGGMPYSFYSSLSAEQVAELAEALGKWLGEAIGQNGEPMMGKLTWQGHPDPAFNENWQRADFCSLRYLHTLLCWMARHHLGTYASV